MAKDSIPVDIDIKEMIKKMQAVYNETAEKRAKLHAKIDEAIDKMSLDGNADPELLEAQIKLLDQSDKIMNSQEKAFLSRIQVIMKQKENEEQTKIYSALAAKILKEAKPAPYVPTADSTLDESSMDRITEALKTIDTVEYNEGELKTDSRDYS